MKRFLAWVARPTLRFWLGFVASLLVVEAGYRAAIYHRYAVTAAFIVTVTDKLPTQTWIGTPHNVRGRFDPGVVTYSNFNAAGELYARDRITANNMGWVSRFDYSVTKEPAEYRVAVIGDSFVASVTNEVPWTDILQSVLDADPGIKQATAASKVTVMSFGLPGAPISRIGDELFDIAKRYDADLIIFNIIPAALDGTVRALKPTASRDFSVRPARPRPAPPPDLAIDGIEFTLFCLPPRVLSNPDCQVSPIWLARDNPAISEADVRSAKMKLARRTMWERVVLSPYPLFALEVLGHPLIARAQAQSASTAAVPATAGDRPPQIAQTVQAFDTLRDIHANMMFTSTATYEMMLDQDPARLERLNQLVAAGADAGIRVLDMCDHMPEGASASEIETWYQMPNDGHFSDKGARVYAEAMHAAIRQHHGLAD